MCIYTPVHIIIIYERVDYCKRKKRPTKVRPPGWFAGFVRQAAAVTVAVATAAAAVDLRASWLAASRPLAPHTHRRRCLREPVMRNTYWSCLSLEL